MKLIVLLLFSAGILTACGGFGIQDAEEQARQEQAKAAQGNSPGFSIWSMFGSSGEVVRKRLNPWIGKAKADVISNFGRPYQCNPLKPNGEICGWHDGGMSDGAVT